MNRDDPEVLQIAVRVAQKLRHDDALGFAWENAVAVIAEDATREPAEVAKLVYVMTRNQLTNLQKRETFATDRGLSGGGAGKELTRRPADEKEPHNISDLIANAPDWLETRVLKARAAGDTWAKIRDEYFPGKSVKRTEQIVSKWLKEIALLLCPNAPVSNGTELLRQSATGSTKRI